MRGLNRVAPSTIGMTICEAFSPLIGMTDERPAPRTRRGCWDSESFVNPSGMTVFRLGSFEFRHASDDDVGQTAQASMRATDVLINIVDVTATEAGATNPYYRPLPLPLTVDGSHAVQQEGYEAPAAVIRGVRIDAHSFYLSVAFGSAAPSDAQVAAADAVLRTLTVR